MAKSDKSDKNDKTNEGKNENKFTLRKVLSRDSSTHGSKSSIFSQDGVIGIGDDLPPLVKKIEEPQEGPGPSTTQTANWITKHSKNQALKRPVHRAITRIALKNMNETELNQVVTDLANEEYETHKRLSQLAENTNSLFHQLEQKIATLSFDQKSSLSGYLNAELSFGRNFDIEPPSDAEFSTVPTLTTPSRRTECNKIFPYQSHKKFDGKNVSIHEFLSSLNYAQKELFLSKEEFMNKMLAATTRQPREYIANWISLGESLESIYFRLFSYYDTRQDAESAKKKLYEFRANKSSTFQRVHTAIGNLALRANSNLPKGDNRTFSTDQDSIEGLLRALPSHSALLAKQERNTLQHVLGRRITYNELVKRLYLIQETINHDIRVNGVSDRFNDRKKIFPRREGDILAIDYVEQAESTMGDENPQCFEISKGNTNRKTANGRGGKTSNRSNFQKKPFNKDWQNNNDWKNKSKPWQNSNFSKRNQNPNFGKGWGMSGTPDSKNWRRNGDSPNWKSNWSDKFCSLCGKTDHTALEGRGCPNMQTDAGDRIKVIPTSGFCSLCPSEIKKRLRHPEHLCMYREKGVFNKNRTA